MMLLRYMLITSHFYFHCFPQARQEVNIRPWDQEFRRIKKGAKRKSWVDKVPVAYWKGNPDVVSPVRLALLECNDTQAWGAMIMRQVCVIIGFNHEMMKLFIKFQLFI